MNSSTISQQNSQTIDDVFNDLEKRKESQVDFLVPRKSCRLSSVSSSVPTSFAVVVPDPEVRVQSSIPDAVDQLYLTPHAYKQIWAQVYKYPFSGVLESDDNKFLISRDLIRQIADERLLRATARLVMLRCYKDTAENVYIRGVLPTNYSTDALRITRAVRNCFESTDPMSDGEKLDVCGYDFNQLVTSFQILRPEKKKVLQHRGVAVPIQLTLGHKVTISEVRHTPSKFATGVYVYNAGVLMQFYSREAVDLDDLDSNEATTTKALQTEVLAFDNYHNLLSGSLATETPRTQDAITELLSKEYGIPTVHATKVSLEYHHLVSSDKLPPCNFTLAVAISAAIEKVDLPTNIVKMLEKTSNNLLV